MKLSFCQFLSDEDGVIVSAEIVLVCTLVVIGCVAGLSILGHAVTTELVDCANACQSMSGYPPTAPTYPDPTYPIPPYSPYPAPAPDPYLGGDLLGYAPGP
jgi:Flp pilus assembly pilin Flp